MEIIIIIIISITLLNWTDRGWRRPWRSRRHNSRWPRPRRTLSSRYVQTRYDEVLWKWRDRCHRTPNTNRSARFRLKKETRKKFTNLHTRGAPSWTMLNGCGITLVFYVLNTKDTADVFTCICTALNNYASNRETQPPNQTKSHRPFLKTSQIVCDLNVSSFEVCTKCGMLSFISHNLWDGEHRKTRARSITDG